MRGPRSCIGARLEREFTEAMKKQYDAYIIVNASFTL